MPAPPLDKTYLYRILHWNCLPQTLERGFYPKRHPGFQPLPTRIGDFELADKRDGWELRTPGAGTIGEHVAFYFAGHSPMLNKIRTGYGVPKEDQRDIVYICLKLEKVVALGLPYLFTNGQANTRRTMEYHALGDLQQLDWDVIRMRYWKDVEEDRDRERKKQAEFLLKGAVPVSAFQGIYVLDEARRTDVLRLLADRGLTFPVRVDTNRDLYY